MFYLGNLGFSIIDKTFFLCFCKRNFFEFLIFFWFEGIQQFFFFSRRNNKKNSRVNVNKTWYFFKHLRATVGAAGWILLLLFIPKVVKAVELNLFNETLLVRILLLIFCHLRKNHHKNSSKHCYWATLCKPSQWSSHFSFFSSLSLGFLMQLITPKCYYLTFS